MYVKVSNNTYGEEQISVNSAATNKSPGLKLGRCPLGHETRDKRKTKYSTKSITGTQNLQFIYLLYAHARMHTCTQTHTPPVQVNEADRYSFTLNQL